MQKIFIPSFVTILERSKSLNLLTLITVKYPGAVARLVHVQCGTHTT